MALQTSQVESTGYFSRGSPTAFQPWIGEYGTMEVITSYRRQRVVPRLVMRSLIAFASKPFNYWYFTMLMLVFYVGEDRYALDSRRVVEVVPRVALKKLHHAPEYVSGLFNYRSQFVPVIDLSQLIQGNSCRPHLSTRIVLVNSQRHDSPNGDSDNTNPTHILGLMAERVTETFNKPEAEFVDPGIKVDAAPYLGEMIADDRGMIQLVRVEYLLPESQRSYLLSRHSE